MNRNMKVVALSIANIFMITSLQKTTEPGIARCEQQLAGIGASN